MHCVFVDVFSVSDLTGLPSSVMATEAVALGFSITVHNADLSLQSIPPSSNGQPVFSFEVSLDRQCSGLYGGLWST